MHPKGTRITPMLGDESLNECTFAESGSRSNQHELTGARACLLQTSVQFFKLFVTFDQVHE
jgi:hypothetical protein